MKNINVRVSCVIVTFHCRLSTTPYDSYRVMSLVKYV